MGAATGLNTREALGRAALEAAPATPTTAEQKAAAKYRAKMVTEGPRPVLNDMLNHAQIQENAELAYQGIEDTIGPDGKPVRSAEQITNKAQYDAAEKRMKDFHEKGIDKMDPADRIRLLRDAEAIIMKTDEGKAFLASFGTVGEKDAAIERIMKQPGFTEKFKVSFDKAVNMVPGRDNVDARRDAMNKAQNEEEVQRRILEVKRQARDRAATEHVDFNAGGTKAGELAALEANETALTKDLHAKEKQLAALDNRLKVLNASAINATRNRDNQGSADATDALRELSTQIDKASKEAGAAKGKLDRLEKLRAERAAAQTTWAKAEEEHAKAERDYRNAQTELYTAKANFDGARLSKMAGEKGKAEAMEGAVADAMTAYVNEQIQKAEAARAQVQEEDKVKAKDAAERALIDRLAIHYKKVDRHNRVTNKDDIHQINADLKLLHEGQDSYKLVVKRALKESGMSEPDALAKINDPAELDRLAPMVLEQLFRKVKENSQISNKEGQFIADMRYGKEAVNKAIENNPALQQQVEEWKRQGLIKDTGDMLDKAKSAGKIGLLMAIILGVGYATMGLGPALLGATGVGATAGVMRRAA